MVLFILTGDFSLFSYLNLNRIFSRYLGQPRFFQISGKIKPLVSKNMICTPKPGHLIWSADYALLLSISFENYQTWSPYTSLQTPKIVKPKMKKKDIETPETTDFSPKAFKKLQRELALARAEIAYLKELEALDRQKQRQKKEKSLKAWSQTTR